MKLVSWPVTWHFLSKTLEYSEIQKNMFSQILQTCIFVLSFTAYAFAEPQLLGANLNRLTNILPSTGLTSNNADVAGGSKPVSSINAGAVNGAINTAAGFGNGVIEKTPQVLTKLQELVSVNTVAGAFNGTINTASGVANGVVENIPQVLTKLKKLVSDLLGSVNDIAGLVNQLVNITAETLPIDQLSDLAFNLTITNN